MQPESIDLLTDFEDHFVQASSGKRFVNFFIDNVFFYFLSTAVEWVVPLYPSSYMPARSENIWAMILANLIASSLFYCLVMGLMELLANGRTIGKYITGTRAILQNGEKLTPLAAFLRGLIKCIPFEAFSALSSPCYPWHDRWTKTYVIDIKESVIINTPNN